MGILDDLKQQADQARLLKEQEEARQAELERIYQTEIRPAMLNIHQYLIDLIEQLAVVTWSVNLSFDFPGIGRVDGLAQRDYSIAIDSQRNLKVIILNFDCVAPEEKRFNLASKLAADDACQFLLAQKVPFSDWAVRDANREITGFIIQSRLRVQASLVIEVDPDNAGILVTACNFEGVEKKTFPVNYKNINEKWLDEVGHYILRKNTTLGKLDISDEQLARIRKLVVEEERRRQEQLAVVVEDKPEDAPVENGLLPKLRNILTKRVW